MSASRPSIKSQIAEVQADKKMPPRDKKEVLADLNEALKSPAPQIENKGNIELVAKYYDKLADAWRRAISKRIDWPDHKKAPETSPGLFAAFCIIARRQVRVRIRIMKLS